MEVEKNDVLIEDHEKRISKCEDNLNNLDDKINTQITEMAETRRDLKNLCRSVDQLTSIIKYFGTLLGGLFVGFFIFMLENHFVIH